MARPHTAQHAPRLLQWGVRSAVVLAILALGACTPHRKIYPRLEILAAGGQYAQAAKLVEDNKSDYGARNAVLYNLDRGVMYHYAGDYLASNQAFQAAEERIDELFTESITGNIGAFLVNDNTLPYRGEDFESVVINVYRALNYALLGSVESALVEARKVDEKLDVINRQYPPEERNAYKEDAFARLLMGIFYELGGTPEDLNDAYISNRKAFSIYKKSFAPAYGTVPPLALKSNLVATAAFMGREELKQARDDTDGMEPESLDLRRSRSRLVIVHFAGRAPIKVEDSINAVMFDGNILRIAFPRYRRLSYSIHGSRVLIDGKVVAVLEEGQPTGTIAVRSLADRKGRIAVKAIARATTKYLASRALQRNARRQGGGAELLAFLLGNVYAVVTEQADLRSWQTLPGKILIADVFVPPGRYRVTVEFISSGGAVFSTKELGEFELAPGAARFISLHTNS